MLCFPSPSTIYSSFYPRPYLLHHPTLSPHQSSRAVLLRSVRFWPGISLAELLSGSGPAFGAPAVTQCLVGCHSAPLALCCSQSFPQQRGQLLIPCPISDSVGLQTHPITSPISSLWSANFLIYACKLYIFSSVKAGTQSLLGIYFLHSCGWVFCDWALCPQVF